MVVVKVEYWNENIWLTRSKQRLEAICSKEKCGLLVSRADQYVPPVSAEQASEA